MKLNLIRKANQSILNCINIIMLVAILFSCNEKESITPGEESSYNIKGSAQKGPFLNGSDITVYELNNNYAQTGKSFIASTDAFGMFDMVNVILETPFVEILADGFYFNEVTGQLSNERISLKGIANIKEQSNINVNILTHLECERVKYLLSNSGVNMQQAKDQVRTELLNIFSIDNFTAENSEKLDILGASTGDAVLLAVSAIMQGNNTTSELSKLLADFISDTKEDGVLNDSTILAKLKGQAIALNCNRIGENLLSKCTELGLDVSTINNFKDFVDHFIENTDIEYSSPFTFPESTENGLNVLDLNSIEFASNVYFSFAAEVPGEGKVVIKMKKTSGPGLWWYQPDQTFGWNVSNFNWNTETQTFTSTENNAIIDLPMEFSENGTATIEYYFNGASEPGFIKNISWGGIISGDFVFPDFSPAGKNLLTVENFMAIEPDTTYTIGLQKEGDWGVNFTVAFEETVNISLEGGWGNYIIDSEENPIKFILEGTTEDDNDISEVILRISGFGEMNITSNDFDPDGLPLTKTFYVGM